MSETKELPGVPASRGIQVVRLGHGANCSSLGSVVDTLFVTAVIGGAVFAAVASALEREARPEVEDAGAAKVEGERKDLEP